MATNEQNKDNYTAAIQPPLQNSKRFFNFSKDTLIDAEITLKDVVDFARKEKIAKLN